MSHEQHVIYVMLKIVTIAYKLEQEVEPSRRKESI
jgi:hypothetical protein